MGVALLVGLAGCSAGRPAGPAPQATGPVDVPVPASRVVGVTRACAALVARLPAELGPGIRRRPVTGDPGRTAAWGDPAITLQCGVPRPDPAIEPLTIDGLAWAVKDVGAGQLWTTRDRAVAVSVRIGDGYEGQGELVVPLAAPVLATLPAARTTPSPRRAP